MTILSRMVHLVLCGALGLMVAGGCVKKRTTLKLALEAKTHQGDPISKAAVHIDGKSIGETDSKGVFVTEMSYELGARPKIEVRKESETYYFAPFIDTIAVDHEDMQPLKLKATLYFVPKPRPMTEAAHAAQEVAPDFQTAETATLPASPPELNAGASEANPTAEMPLMRAANIPVADIAPDDVASSASGTTSEQAFSDAGTPPQEAPESSNQLPATIKSAAPRSVSQTGRVVSAGRVDELAARAAESAGNRVEASSGDSLIEDAKATPSSTAWSDRAIDDPEGRLDGASLLPETAAPSEQAMREERTPSASAETVSAEEGSTFHPQAKDPEKAGPIMPSHLPAVLTVHVAAAGMQEDAGILGADILYAESRTLALKAGCTTNARGRCVIRFATAPEGPITIVASKKGFRTKTSQVMVKGQSKEKLSLERGLTLDIYALTKVYNHTEGLGQVEVLIDNQRVGYTDRLGHFSYGVRSKKDAMVSVTLKPAGYLPEVYETDFVASGPMSLVKYFADPSPQSAQVAILAPMAAGSVDQTTLAHIAGPIQQAIKTSARKHLFSTAAFKEVPQGVFGKALETAQIDSTELKRRGWETTPFKATFDVLMVPTIITGAKPAIEISLVNSSGQVLAAAREELESISDDASIDRALYVVSHKIIKSFPFEGAVVGKEADKVLVNIGHAQGRGIKAGDLVDVYGVQAEKFGVKEQHRKIGTLTIREVFDSQSKSSVGWLAPRAIMERGDLIILRPRRSVESTSAQIRVSVQEGQKAVDVAQANIYLNGHWIGTTDESGRLYVDPAGSGSLRVVKHGFREHLADAKFSPKSRMDIGLVRESSFLRVDSKPSGAKVFVEGKVVGRTPLTTPLAVPSGFIKLRLESGSGWKPYSTVLELEEGTLDLTGPRAIVMETDFMAQAHRLMKVGKNAEAAQILERIPVTHSDHLVGRYEAGDIWLSVLDNPAKAEACFSEVLANEGVKSFADKRFVGAHINAAITQFRLAETLIDQDPSLAKGYYQKVMEGLDAVLPHLRFVPSDQYNQAVHSVDYHRALARHRLWSFSHDPRLLVDTVKTWQAYLEGDARSLPPEGAAKALVENAEVYFKQAVASLEQARRAVPQ